ncbi:MAG TPA: phosphopyruvate hydratase [Vitreimonas sp.]|nr:phosphopyruvate hydratase [Vitreimonas sp.]
MTYIAALRARTILDSRGTPTIETDVILNDGSMGRASVPSGASTGTHESLELRDGDQTRFFGKGVQKAVDFVNNELCHALTNNNPLDQENCDQELVMRDGTANLSRYGANTLLSISLALSKAAAASLNIPYYQYVRELYHRLTPRYHSGDLSAKLTEPLPQPMFNLMNGGAHTDWQSTNFQEFMIVPHAAKNFSQAVEWGSEVYHHLKAVLKSRGYITLVGDEGGFAPALKNDEEALEILLQAIEKAGFKPGEHISLALDPATSELYENGIYNLRITNQHLTSAQLIEMWQDWVRQYPIISIEDGLAEDDWQGWQDLNQALGQKILLVGDDFLVTNTERIERAQLQPSCNALLTKVNQIGTLSETLHAILLSRQAGWKIIMSHRSGETEDTTIAELAIGVAAEYVKMGSLARSERTAKYNQLLRIEEVLSNR